MKAKFVYEAIEDILKPKSDEEILSLMGDLSPNELLLKSTEEKFLGGVKRALEMGANINFDNDWPLRLASQNGYIDIVELLLKNGANIHAEGDYSLAWASACGYYDVVELLLIHGANAHKAIELASDYSQKDVIKLLKKYM